jgi:hypothetical protein
VRILILGVAADKRYGPGNNAQKEQGEDNFSGVRVRKMVPVANRTDKMAGFRLFVSAQNLTILT